MNNVFEKFQASSTLIIILAILKEFFATFGVGNVCFNPLAAKFSPKNAVCNR